MKICVIDGLKIILLFTLAFFTLQTKAQKFEGKIVYVVKYNYKDPTKVHFNFTDTVILFIKDGMLIKTNSRLSENRFFILMNKSFYVNDFTRHIKKDTSETIQDLEQLNSNLLQTKYKENINGYECIRFDLKEKTNSGINYSSFWITNKWELELSIGSFIFKELGISIKSKGNFPNCIVEINAIEISPIQLEDKFFELPDYPIHQVNMKNLSKKFVPENE